jgi:MinD-like ATPase involved in chromosome partitioning or flagellar assembly
MSSLLVTVVGPTHRRDLSLPADAPVQELIPTLVQLVGDLEDDGSEQPEGWRLSRGTGQSISYDSSLGGSGVLDGSVLYLTRVRTALRKDLPPPPPVFDDHRTPAERTSAALPPRHRIGRRVLEALAAFFGGVGPRPAPTEEVTPEGLVVPTNDGHITVDPSSLSAPSPDALTVADRSSPMQRARETWRATNYLEMLESEIVEPRLRRCVTIAVVSPKGGVGKTTTTALLGTLFALLRRDRVVAVDTNPDYGSLGRVLTPDQRLFVDDLLERLDKPNLTLTALDAQLGRSPDGLMVLPAPTDPARMERLDEAAYSKVIKRLQEFVGIVMLDCGTGLQEPASRAALKMCDQIVLVTDAEPAAASLVAEAGGLLMRSGKPITLVVNKMPATGSRLDLERLGQYLSQASALVVIPSDQAAASRLTVGEFKWRDAPHGWKTACRQLAVALVAEWPRLGVTLYGDP